MPFASLQRPQQGFTLVELMVVVAIIGILSAVAVPNFKKYQAKSRTSEAKLQLAAAYTALQSFYSDYDTYQVCLKFMGYNPTNDASQRMYTVGFGSSLSTGDCSTCITIATANGATFGVGACYAAPGDSIFPAGKALGSTPALTTFTAAEIGNAAISEDTFRMGAMGIVDQNFAAATNASAFSIDHNKLLKQYRAGY